MKLRKDDYKMKISIQIALTAVAVYSDKRLLITSSTQLLSLTLYQSPYWNILRYLLTTRLLTLTSGNLQLCTSDISKPNVISSIFSYYTKMRNYNVSFSPWTDTNTGLGPGSCRESRFIKPLNLPTIQSTRCTNIQRYRRFGMLSLGFIY